MSSTKGRRMMRLGVCGLAMVMAAGTPQGWAQVYSSTDRPTGAFVLETFYLANVNQTTDANEIVTAMRNLMNPFDKIFYVPSQNAIIVSAPSDQLKLARRLLDDLDRPKKTYRLVFTTDDLDGDKVIGTQHFAMVVVPGGRTDTRVGSKVPVVTGSYDGVKGAEKQVTYLDVGFNVSAGLDESSQGLRLQTKVERTSTAPDEHSALGADDPVVRQAHLEGTANIVPGKVLNLGSLDVPGSTRHVNVSVLAEVVR